MDRVFESGAVGSPPSAPASPSSGYTTAGNPATATPATKPGPYWFHQVTEELRAVIAAAGLAPDHTNLTQVRDAIDSLISAKAGLGSSGMVQLNSATTLTNAAHMGKTLLLYGSSAYAVTLPLTSTVITGRRVHFHNVGSANITVQRQGSDLIYPNGVNTTSINVGPGDTLTLEAYNGTTWFAVGGSNQLGAASVFGSSLSGSGYQKLPSGLIVQWGNGTVSNMSQQDFNFTISFPNSCHTIVAADIGGTTTPLGISQVTSSVYRVFLPSTGTKTFRYIAIGN